jgi:hypothetical protein
MKSQHAQSVDTTSDFGSFGPALDNWLLKYVRRQSLWLSPNNKAGIMRALEEETDAVLPGCRHVIVAVQEADYLVSLLNDAQGADIKSYVEVRLRPDHSMYGYLANAVAALNIAGEFTVVGGLGEQYNAGVYSVIITPEQAQLLRTTKE